MKSGGVPCLLYLLSGDHMLLVNEGIVALTVATALKNGIVVFVSQLPARSHTETCFVHFIKHAIIVLKIIGLSSNY